MIATHRVRRRLHPEVRRGEMESAALRVFGRLGYRAATVDEIAAEAGTAKGTFYLYFESKQAAFLHLLDDFRRLVERSFAPLEPEPAPLPAVHPVAVEALLVAAYRTFLRAVREHEALARLFLQEAVFDEACRKRREEIYASFAERARRDLELAQRLGVVVRPLDPDVISNAVVGMIESVAESWVLRGDRADAGLDRLAAELARFELYGVLGRPATKELRDAP
ncbi:MAG: TetR/AcrR family transcriptional regulator [Deltaproteobacteria bacterium]|nr:TetR/AcrR family transcriptional regulator [Deltaproteobacteria bacterium]